MFGIDLGITVSSVVCMTEGNKVIDYQIYFGDTKNKDDWKRVCDMAESICDGINTIHRANPETRIAKLVSIEEPVFVYRVRNPKSYFNLTCLYTQIRKKLQVRGYKIYSINPISAKATARALAFKDKKLSEKYAKRGRLNKRGMVLAYRKVTGSYPPVETWVRRETFCDAFFIARTGIDRRRVMLNR